MSDVSPWICETCQSQITDGFVLVFNSNEALGPIGSRPIQASPDHPPGHFSDTAVVARDPSVATFRESQRQQIDGALWLVKRPVNVGIAAFCATCDTYSSEGAYQIPATPSAQTWIAWIVHLREKTWMGKGDLHRMTAYWFRNRGLQYGHYIG